MASPANPQHEPTMEEILASIRKIISEDTTEPAVEDATDTAVAEDETEILELTQEVPEEQTPKHGAALENDVVFEEVEEPKMPESSSPENAEDTGDEIFSDKTRAALDDAFAGLQDNVPAQAAEQPVLPALTGHSIEEVFQRTIREGFEPLLREHLQANSAALLEQVKPLIREWMDENFPSLLEAAVRNEVARAVKARNRR